MQWNSAGSATMHSRVELAYIPPSSVFVAVGAVSLFTSWSSVRCLLSMNINHRLRCQTSISRRQAALPARGTRLALSSKSKQASSVWSWRTKEHLRSWKRICGTSACTFAFSPSLHSHSYSRTCDHVLLVLVSSVARAQVAGRFLCWVPVRYLHFFSRFRSVVPLGLRALVNLLLPPSSLSVVLFVSLSWRRAPAVIFLVPLSQVLFTSTSDLNWFLLEQHHGLPSPHTSIDHTSSPSYHHFHTLVTFDIFSEVSTLGFFGSTSTSAFTRRVSIFGHRARDLPASSLGWTLFHPHFLALSCVFFLQRIR